MGIVAGDADAELQVLAKVTEEDEGHIQAYLDGADITVACPETPCMLDIRLTGWLGGHKAVTRVANNHTNLVYMEKDGQILLEKPMSASAEDNLQDKSVLNVRDILTFAETVSAKFPQGAYRYDILYTHGDKTTLARGNCAAAE